MLTNELNPESVFVICPGFQKFNIPFDYQGVELYVLNIFHDLYQ